MRLKYVKTPSDEKWIASHGTQKIYTFTETI